MSFLSKPKVVLWPKDKSAEIYFNSKDNNFFSLDINLWSEKQPKDLESLLFFIRQNKITSISLLIPDDVAVTKSFVYDTKIESIDIKEVIGLASGFINFNIDPEFINYSLIQTEDKTIINAVIYDKSKFDQLKNNLSQVGLQIEAYQPVSAAISNIMSTICLSEFFLIYPLNEHEYTLLLSKNNQVYLTSNFKGPDLDIQKTVNYAQLYFNNPVKKIYHPDNKEIEIITTTEMEKTPYNESQIVQNLKYPANLPIPVVGCLGGIIKSSTDINSPKTQMTPKKNLLPIIAVAIFSFAIVSFLVYYFMTNKNTPTENPEANSPVEETIPTSIPETVPTEAPKTTITEIDKKIKIQVLNATEINGQAATLKAKLVALGFTNVSVGNATTTATENAVSAKSATISAYFQTALADYFPGEYTEDLKTTSTYDAVFTIGTDLSKTSSTSTSTKTATATPTKKATATPTLAE
ncbi:MAG: LytR C-terminal domain-containing protein [Candidatus Shapirobacteria bacterium]|nr:LytR C-terminal domain-containing protein [Candidatus Shapirobacteria bacterium]